MGPPYRGRNFFSQPPRLPQPETPRAAAATSRFGAPADGRYVPQQQRGYHQQQLVHASSTVQPQGRQAQTQQQQQVYWQQQQHHHHQVAPWHARQCSVALCQQQQQLEAAWRGYEEGHVPSQPPPLQQQQLQHHHHQQQHLQYHYRPQVEQRVLLLSSSSGRPIPRAWGSPPHQQQPPWRQEQQQQVICVDDLDNDEPYIHCVGADGRSRSSSTREVQNSLSSYGGHAASSSDSSSTSKRQHPQTSSSRNSSSSSAPLFVLDADGDPSLKNNIKPAVSEDPRREQRRRPSGINGRRCQPDALAVETAEPAAGRSTGTLHLAAAPAAAVAEARTAGGAAFAAGFELLLQRVTSRMQRDGVLLQRSLAANAAAAVASKTQAEPLEAQPVALARQNNSSSSSGSDGSRVLFFLDAEALSAALRQQQIELERKSYNASREPLRRPVGGPHAGFTLRERYFAPALRAETDGRMRRAAVASIAAPQQHGQKQQQEQQQQEQQQQQHGQHEQQQLATFEATPEEIVRSHLFLMSLHRMPLSVCFFCAAKNCPRSKDAREPCPTAICTRCGNLGSRFSASHRCEFRPIDRIALFKTLWDLRYRDTPRDPRLRCLRCAGSGHWLCGPALHRLGQHSLSFRSQPHFAELTAEGMQAPWTRRRLRDYDDKIRENKKHRGMQQQQHDHHHHALHQQHHEPPNLQQLTQLWQRQSHGHDNRFSCGAFFAYF